jgi:hypothetical protein
MAYANYPARSDLAERVRERFSSYLEGVSRQSSSHAPQPSVDTIEELIQAAFWTSLRRDELYVPKVSLALVPRDVAGDPVVFERSMRLVPASLARIAPAVERPGIHFGVWPEQGTLAVWGTTRTLPKHCLVLEVAAPGLIVIKQQRAGEQTKYANVAVLEGEEVKIVDEHASSLPDCPSLLTSLLGFDSPAAWGDSINVLVQLSVSMRAHNRGGLLLVVPTKSESWRDSIVTPVPYALAPPFSGLCQLMRESPERREELHWQAELARTVEMVAGLTAVDGATLLNDTYDLLAFGAKIARRRGSSPVEQVTVTEPIEGGHPAVVHPTELGGTRHLSAAQFVHDQHDAVALVASQDGRFTIFAWSPCEDMVHAHRVETLLL